MDRLAAHGMALHVLHQDRRRATAVQRDLEDGAGVGERVAQDPRVDGEELRLLPAPVDHAGNLAGAAEPAGRTGALGGAGGEVEPGGSGDGHERPVMLAEAVLGRPPAGTLGPCRRTRS